MRNITIGDTRLVLRDLLTNRIEDLRASATGRLYEPRLRAKREAIDALPESVLSRSPFAEELGVADLNHDSVGTAVHYVCLAVLAHPGLSPEMKQAAEAAQGTFIPQLGQLRETFADAPTRSRQRRMRPARWRCDRRGHSGPGRPERERPGHPRRSGLTAPLGA